MQSQKILNSLKKPSYSRLVTRKWNIVNDQSNTTYAVGNKIIDRTEVLKSNLCNYSDAYIRLRSDITKCIIKFDGRKMNDVKDLDFVMPMYNLL